MGATSLDEALYAATLGPRQYLIMKALIRRGANVNARRPNGFTPLLAAACIDQFTFRIQILLDNKADFNARTEGTFGVYNTLHLASAFGNSCVVKLFLDLRIDLESTTTSSEHPRIIDDIFDLRHPGILQI
jgi:ankyrin repeat protein